MLFVPYTIHRQMGIALILVVFGSLSCAQAKPLSKTNEPEKPSLASKPLGAEQLPIKATLTKSVAGKAKPKAFSAEKLLRVVLKKYRRADAIGMKMKKTLVSPFLSDPKVSQGNLLFSQGRLRVEVSKPDANLLVMNDKMIWLETRLPADMGGGVQVSKTSLETAGKSSTLLAIIFGREKLSRSFSIQFLSRATKTYQIELKPKPDNKIDIEQVIIEIPRKSKQISSIGILDKIENKTRYEFTEIDFNPSVKAHAFRYRPPKGAEVTEF